MTKPDVKSSWTDLWAAVDATARSSKRSHEALDRLSDCYASLDLADQVLVAELLGEWLWLDDERKRFDALALIWKHEIRSALPQLDLLQRSLACASSPGASFERAKVLRIIKSIQRVDI